MNLTPTRAVPRRDLGQGENKASLHAIMTTPPMSAAAHAAVTLQRTIARRLAEDARDQRALADDWSAR